MWTDSERLMKVYRDELKAQEEHTADLCPRCGDKMYNPGRSMHNELMICGGCVLSEVGIKEKNVSEADGFRWWNCVKRRFNSFRPKNISQPDARIEHELAPAIIELCKGYFTGDVSEQDLYDMIRTGYDGVEAVRFNCDGKRVSVYFRAKDKTGAGLDVEDGRYRIGYITGKYRD